MAHSFFDGRALVERDGKRFFIDKAGNAVIRLPEPKGFAEDFESGLTSVCEEIGGPCRYIDTNGKVVIPGPFKFASRFHRGIAHVQQYDGEFAYLDVNGKVVFEYRR